VIIHSPAGYGKTAACALALAPQSERTVWYTAQPWQAGNFVEPLVANVRKLRGDAGRLTLATANSGRPASDTPETLRRWAQLVGATFADELSHIPERIFIVIEDYHVLDGDLAFGEFLTGAMRVLPEHVTFVVIGRTSPPLPLAEWIASGRAAVFDGDALRFTASETADLAARNGVALDTDRARALCAQCEGWAAGIVLLVKAGDKPLPTHGGTQAPTAYLLEQYVDDLPSELRTFLEHVAILDVVRVATLSQDSALADVRAKLQELERRGAMITVSESGETHRIHPLLQEAVLSGVRNRDGDAAVATLHRWAADAQERAGRITSALFHAERSRDDANLARLLAARADVLFSSGNGQTATQALHELLKRGAVVPALAARIEALALRARGLLGIHDQLVAGLRVAEDTDDDGEAFALRALLMEDSLNRLDPVADSEVDRLFAQAATRGPHAQSLALTLSGWTDAVDARFDDALGKGMQAASLASGVPTLVYRASLLQAYALTCRGDIARADAMMNGVLRDLEETDLIVLLCYTLSWYARLALCWGNLAAAQDYAEQGVKLGSNLNLPSELAALYATLAEAYADAGDRERSGQAASAAQRYAPAAWYVADRGRLAQRASQMTARSAFCAHEPAAALSLIRVHLEAAEERTPQRASVLADAALYALACHVPEARDLLAQASAAVSNATVIDVIDAIVLAEAAALTNVLAPARPGSAYLELPALQRFRPLLSKRQDLSALLAHSEKARAIAPVETAQSRRFYALALAAVLGTPGLSASSHPSGAGQHVQAMLPTVLAPRGSILTKREEEVLSLIALGLTNKEIAQRLTLSRRTVDTHVEHVLGKLEATTRTRAVAEARRRGLLADAPQPVAM
jgi:LuxR family maltose regulon positive regulatory protein